jgi:predicted acyltransferase
MNSSQRIVSIDLFRGLVMFLLMAEGAMVYDALMESTGDRSAFHVLIEQFHHHPWNGLRFWDLIQPYFMFIVGVAMWFSVKSRKAKGQSRKQITVHILKRSAILLALGVTLHIGYNRKLVWELWNVLSQLSITIPIAYFLMRRPWKQQLMVSLMLLVLTELLYRYTGIAGFDQPFVKDQNFGSYMDMVLMGKINPGGGWVAINCLPSAAHTIWGVLAGMLLNAKTKPGTKLRYLVYFGVAGLVAGYGLDIIGVTPIIKRICTSSFILASGGWCLLTLALFYWLIDIKRLDGWVWPFAIVGMNSIFIYVFTETVGKQWMTDFAGIFIFGILGLGILGQIVNAFLVLAASWGLCYWLYSRKIFIRV